ncbi:MAG: rhomboid family intramembrane serine protease [Planctomycetia bacterium]|nr:rhomboid family intramembrane serine protease [Planctomycetia bacterium]MCC7316270.1 rhomboid family intramembrane serine protease [Planctomycetota bacterium]
MRRAPQVNFGLIVANVLVYIVLDLLGSSPGASVLADWKRRGVLDPQNLSVYQFFTYQFLHGDFLHLLGNMLFLWVFGNSVNGKMGNIPYLFFYLACGVFAGLGFALLNTDPCLGASGSIAGVTTAFLVLFPRSHITVVYWLVWFIGTAQIQAMLLIVVKIILWDNIVSPRLSGGHDYVSVAYSAHVAGYLFGFVWCSFMLLIRAIPRDQYDIIALAKRYHQRHQYRAMMADPNKKAEAVYGRVARPISADGAPEMEVKLTPEQEALMRRRSEIGELLDAHDYEKAADEYVSLVEKYPDQCLPRRQMMDVANQLMQVGRYPVAAAAYENYLKHYPTDAEVEQVKLVLGILYAKYLEQYEAAQNYLRESLTRLTNEDQIHQATHWLEEATVALGRGPATA